MENHVKKLYHRLPMFLIGLVVLSSLFVSCKDVYMYDDKEPPWLGESIYEYLATDGNYTNLVKIIDDLGYSEVLRKTGSKTLFVADDAAFERFYSSNEWGTSSYSDLTESQKKLILNFSIVNNAYLIETLSNYYDNTLMEGSALRRNTSVSYLDSIPFVKDEDLPVTNRWRYYLDDSKPGMYLLQDGSAYPIVHLLQKSLDYYGITNSDFKVMTGIERVRNDAHIFSHKVIDPDITCKNGYIHKLDDLLTIPASMAAYIRTVPAMNYFSTMLDWFSVPIPDMEKTRAYKAYLAERDIPFSIQDTVFTMRYFNGATDNGALRSAPNGVAVPTNTLLLFDPGYNKLINATGALQSDMAAIFSPTNKALEDYLLSEKGRPLHDRFETITDIFPKETDGTDLMQRKLRIMAKLINRHLRTSLVISIPSLFWKMVDNTSSLLGTTQEDIVDSLNYIALNGLVYATNKVYPPDDFISVYGPVFFSDKTSVLNYGIETYKYNLYLNSMVNRYAFVAPTNEALKRFIDPVTYGIDGKETVLEFWYDDSPDIQAVKAKIYAYNKATNTVGDLVGEVVNTDFIKSRLNSIIDQSIIVKDFVGPNGAFKDGYYLTKDGNVVKTTGIEGLTVNDLSSPTTTFQGGGDLITPSGPQYVSPKDSGIYHQENGTTFLTDKLIQTPLKSVYSILNDDVNYPEFQQFNDLLNGFSNKEIYMDESKPSGIDKTIKFFNSYRYTVYVPDNAAMQQAYDSAWIKPWNDIYNMPTEGANPTETAELVAAKELEIEKLVRFVRYHFQDNSVFISPNQSFAGTFQTATIKQTPSEPEEPDYDPSFLGTAKNKFYRIAVSDTTDTSSRKTLSLKCEKYGDGVNPYVVDVDVSDANYYNIMTRDYIFNVKLSDITSRTDEDYQTSLITTSSTAVIHRIGKVLRFE